MYCILISVAMFLFIDNIAELTIYLKLINLKKNSMIKQTLIASMILSSVAVTAQDAVTDPAIVKNKKGQNVLPKTGDIALGFNAVPLMDFLVGSVRVGSNQNSPSSANASSFTENAGNQIVGKYFLNEKTALRVRIGFNTLSTTQTQLVQDSKARYDASLSGLPEDIQAAALLTLEDKRFSRTNNLAFAVGYEKRRGYQRLIGFYGAEIGISRIADKQNFYYANGFSQDYQVNYTTIFAQNGAGTTALSSLTGNTTRVLNTETPTQWGIGARGFVGIEYFVFAKISIAAEYGLGYSYSRSKATKVKQETYSQTSTGPKVIIEEFDTKSPNTLRGFGVDNGINSTLNKAGISGSTASISLLFHF